jgi:hypothetical protein
MCKHTVVNEVENELRKNPGVIASVDTETGKVLTFMAPKPYWETAKNDAGDTGSLTASEVTALEKERNDLIAALPRLKKGERSKATTRINVIEGTLRRDRSIKDAEIRTTERAAERPLQRYGQPGNSSPAERTKWATLEELNADLTAKAQAAQRALAGA